MYILILFMGTIIGYLFCKFINYGMRHISGIIQIDNVSGLCRVKVTDNNLSNNKIKKVVFIVEHNVNIRDDNNDYNE